MNHMPSCPVLQQYLRYCLSTCCKRSFSVSVTNWNVVAANRHSQYSLHKDRLLLTYTRIHQLRKNSVLETNNSRRLLSGFQNDDVVKSWMKEIREDFENEAKITVTKDVDKSHQTTVIDETHFNDENVVNIDETVNHKLSDTTEKHPLDDVHFEELHGFTADEMISVLNVLDKTDSSLPASEYNDDIESDTSDSESDNLDSESEHRRNKKGLSSDRVQQEDQSDSGTSFNEKNAATSLKTDWSVVEIEDFVNLTREEVEEPEEQWKLPVDTNRGQAGVFDLPDLVTVLQTLNAMDVVVISVPPHIEFAQQLVIASARSHRHLSAMAMEVNHIYKQKKHSQDKYLKLEGEGTEWVAVDMGNIVLHLFMPKVREEFDLETLWTVGEEFDPQCSVEEDPYVFTADDLPWLEELEKKTSSD